MAEKEMTRQECAVCGGLIEYVPRKEWNTTATHNDAHDCVRKLRARIEALEDAK